MFKSRIFVLAFVFCFLILIGSIHQSQAGNPTLVDGGGNPVNAPWFFQTIEAVNGEKVGQHTSIAFNKGTTTPYISSYDQTDQELHLIYPVSSNGNCGPGNAWYCEIIDSEGDVGQYSSIDYYNDFSAYGRKIGIAYHDATNSALKVAIWSCSLISCGWQVSTIEPGSGDIYIYGRFVSLKFDSTGDAYIAYNLKNSVGDDHLKFAQYVGTGGNCGIDGAANQWQCDFVESGDDGVGNFASLALTSNDVPYIASYHMPDGVLRLCNRPTFSWYCQTIDNADGRFSSLAIDSNNQAHIAYYHTVAGSLKYAEYVGTGGNCGLNSATTQFEYQCDTIAAIGSDSNLVGISLALGTFDYPIIAYQDTLDPSGISVLNIARPKIAYSQVSGNCGPQVGLLYSWRCDTIDDATEDGGGGHLYEADYVSVDVNYKGLSTIAYYEYDDYHDEGRLKIAYQQQLEYVFLPMITK